MEQEERIIYYQPRQAGSAISYIAIAVLIGIIGGVCAYGISVGVEPKIIGVFCALPLLLGLFFLHFVKYDSPGKLVVSNKRLYRCDIDDKILESVSLDEIGVLRTSRSTLSVFKKTGMGWSSIFFHGLKDPRAISDAAAGFCLKDQPIQEYKSKLSELRKVFWAYLGFLFLQLIAQVIWVMTDNKELQDITAMAIAGTVVFALVAMSYSAVFRSTAVVEIYRQGKNIKLQMLSKQIALYVFGQVCPPKITSQGKNLRLWTGIHELDGRQGRLITGGRRSLLATQEGGSET